MKAWTYGTLALALGALGFLACGGGGEDTGDAAETVDIADAADPGVAPDGDTQAEADTGNPDWPPPDTGPGLGLDYESLPAGAAPRFDPASPDWTATGWPSDRFRREDGSVDLSGIPTRGIELLENYLAHGEAVLDGFGLNGAIYLQLGGEPDLATLPTAAGSTDPLAGAQLVNVTPGSARYGERVPLLFRWYGEGSDPYYPDGTLAMRPVFGFPLTEGETWCALLTRGVQDTTGAHLAQAPGFDAAMEEESWLAPLLVWLADSPLRRADLAVGTCFTTQHATSELRRVREYLEEEPAPEVDWVVEPLVFGEFHGVYRAPNFQAGEKPYASEGGDIQFDADGDPIVADPDELVRYMLLVPQDRPMPAAGWPVVMYAHGTTGDYESCWGRWSGIRAEGLAMICIDQPLHGIRGDDYTDNELITYGFNIMNPAAGRTSFRQSAIDSMTEARMIAAGSFDLAASETLSGDEVRLDPEKIYFFGHSHGGLSGALVLGVEPLVRGAMLSGAAGVLTITVLRRKEPVDIKSLVRVLLGTTDEDLDSFHPVLSVVQMLVDATDPVNYAPYWLAPAGGGAPKHVFVSQGTADADSPWLANDALAAAGGLTPILPLAHENFAATLRGLEPQNMPLSLNAASGTATAGTKQWQDGSHFVALTDDQAEAMWRTFFRTLVDEDTPVTIDVGDVVVTTDQPVEGGDGCADAGVIDMGALPAAVGGATALASDDFSAAGCGGDAGGEGERDLVWSLTPEDTGTYRVSLSWPSPVDPKDDPQGPGLVYLAGACDDIAGSCVGRMSGKTLDADLEAGKTYYLIVDGPVAPSRSHFRLVISRRCQALDCGERVCGDYGCGSCGECAAGQACNDEGQCVGTPAGDTCADAPAVGALPWSISGDTSIYANDYGYAGADCPGVGSSYGNGSADLAYRFDVPADGVYDFTLNASYDGNLYVVRDCADIAGSCLGGDRWYWGREKVQLDLGAGETVFVIVDGAGNGSSSRGRYTLRVATCEPQCGGDTPKACGSDGCGGSCGGCGEVQRCGEENTCEPIPYLCDPSSTCDETEPGELCANPFEIASLPYADHGSTSAFEPDYSYGSGACPGDSGSFGSSGEDVVYAFAPAEAGLYRFGLDSGLDASLYVTDDCADIGGSCLGAKRVTGEKGRSTLYLDLEAEQRVYAIVDRAGSYDFDLDRCVPDCTDRVCGSNGCNGSCGSCEAGLGCNKGECKVLVGAGCKAARGISKAPYEFKGNTSGFLSEHADGCTGDTAGAASPEVVFEITAPASGWYTITLKASWDAIFYLAGDCEDVAGTCATHDRAEAPSKQAHVELGEGEQLYLIVDGAPEAPDSAGGAFELRFAERCFPSCEGKTCGADGCGGSCGTCEYPADLCAPGGVCTDPREMEGDSCASARPVGALPFQGQGDSAAMHDDYGTVDGLCPGWVAKGQLAADEVWRLQATTAGTYSVDVVPEGFDAFVYVLDEGCDRTPGTCLAAGDGELSDHLDVALEAGQTAFVVVDGASNRVPEAGSYSISVSGP